MSAFTTLCLVAFVLPFLPVPVAADLAPSPTSALDSLTTAEEREFLMRELSRVRPPERIRTLSGFGDRQSELGGGFYGMLPDQLADADRVPIPSDDAGRMAAALHLARQRATNLRALLELSPAYALGFRGEPLLEFLQHIEPPRAGAEPMPRLSLVLDLSALTGFFAACEDGEISAEEATALAHLPSNRAMLRHRRDLGYVPEPLPDPASLATMIRIAGSEDPLDRLWCWVNPQNAFGYADLALHVAGYTRLLEDLHGHSDRLTATVLHQIAAYVPPDTAVQARFALTVGWAIRGWATPEMAGLNVEQVKDDWRLLYGTLVEETFHWIQLDLCPTIAGTSADEFSDLVAAELDDPGYERLYEAVAYTVLEGSANLVRGAFVRAEVPRKAPEGARLLDRFVREVVEAGEVEAADALLAEGLRSNGPFYGLGWTLASAIARSEGERAVGEYLVAGPLRFFLRGTALATERGALELSPGVVAAVESLERRTAR